MTLRARHAALALAGVLLPLLLGAALAAAPAAHAGAFSVTCGFSHRLADDPIVHPGHAGMSHHHDYYGARSASASSTWESMVRSRSTCAEPRDTAGYWHPTLRVDGRARRGVARAYYSRGGKPTVRPYPPDLRIVAGNAKAPAPQSLRVTWWQCRLPEGAGPGVGMATGTSMGAGKRSATVPRCRHGQQLTSNVRFPDCWDGLRLDSPDHRSHMASSRRGACPRSHPTPLPELVLSVAWDVRPRGGRQVRLSSGGAWTMHADLWNTWQQRRLKALVNECLNLEVDCGSIASRRR